MSNTAELHETENGQIVRLPDEFRFPGLVVSIRRDGDAVVLEPLHRADWAPGFFEAIRIDDPAFQRPDQGELPPIISLD